MKKTSESLLFSKFYGWERRDEIAACVLIYILLLLTAASHFIQGFFVCGFADVFLFYGRAYMFFILQLYDYKLFETWLKAEKNINNLRRSVS